MFHENSCTLYDTQIIPLNIAQNVQAVQNVQNVQKSFGKVRQAKQIKPTQVNYKWYQK